MPAAHNNKTRSEGRKKKKMVWGQTTVTHPAALNETSSLRKSMGRTATVSEHLDTGDKRETWTILGHDQGTAGADSGRAGHTCLYLLKRERSTGHTTATPQAITSSGFESISAFTLTFVS